MRTKILRWGDGWLPNALALGYALGGYALGLWACAAPEWWINAPGVLLAAYLIHECAHNTIFIDNRWNAALGEALMWLTGAGHHSLQKLAGLSGFMSVLNEHVMVSSCIDAHEWCDGL